ncbi:MAG: iron-containing alcohol dehydrogenase [Luminiphilus sp.]|nr:iron-containing alcohol dehydrogenase [Luminiphilus sp.]MDG2037490.1 iron-containing alcohol dehydrogenase [Luminiphilus sp.]
MLRSMPVRRFKRGFQLGLIKLLIGNKAAGVHLSYVGQGATADLCRRIVDIGHTDVLVVTDKALKELGLAERALAGLIDAGVNLHWYAGVDPDPTFAHVVEGSKVLRSAGCTAVVAVGGGSSMDAAKIIACTRSSDESPDKWVGLNKTPEDIVPIYAVPTTSGTGSEATMGAVIKDPAEKLKHIIVAEGLLPQAVALDPELLLGLPAPVTAATGIDALTHGIEAYICIWDRGTRKENGRLAVQGVFRWLERAVQNPGDIESRQGMAVAAYHAGIAINQVGVGNVHAIAHQLGARFGIPHGQANALVLPHVLKACLAEAETALAELAVVTQVSDAASPAARAQAFVDAVTDLIAKVGIADTDPRIQSAEWTAVAHAAMDESDGYVSPRLLSKAEMMEILERITVR